MMAVARLRWLHAPLAWNRRWSLWVLLVALVVALLGALVWLAGRYEASLVQSQLEHDTSEILNDIRVGLTRNTQRVQALHAVQRSTDDWHNQALDLLRDRREILHLELRDPALELRLFKDSPYRPAVFGQAGREGIKFETTQACNTALRLKGPVYSDSYFLPQDVGAGLELMDMCIPMLIEGQLMGYTVTTYALQEILLELVNKQLSRGQGLSFTDSDGSRLAIIGNLAHGGSFYKSQLLLNLPGTLLVVRMDNQLSAPNFFPNMLTALVSGLALTLIAVLLLLSRDMRRRVRVEHDLADALAFRKAMEDSLVTGLRARDLEGRITYVNPAFCQMVGVEAKELLNTSAPNPYWPPELADVYEQRQALRQADCQQQQGGVETVFMRHDGTRFPVLIIEAPLINAKGKHTGWMSAIIDISEQRRVEEMSRTSQDRLQATARLAMVGEMASLLSHELNQPLAAISSYATGSLNLLADAADTSGPLNADLQVALRRIREQAERAGRVIKSVHDVVRRREHLRECVAPRALFEAIMPLVRLQAVKLSVRVAIEIDPAACEVLCDRTMVEQVLLNLSRNGMQAMVQAKGLGVSERLLTLRVAPATLDDSTHWVSFSVTDQGVGISDDVAEKLFSPFFTTKVEGMGLGLSLCRTVIEQHGGHLGFKPARPRGTVFSFTLPSNPQTTTP